MIETLPRVLAEAPDRPELAGPDHPIRKVTRQIAFEPGAWTKERATKVAELFDALAPEWHTRQSQTRMEPLLDALERGGAPDGFCLEVGSGTGFGTVVLAERYASVVAVDLSMQMLRRAPARAGHRVCGDGARLPIGSALAQVVVLVNAFLFPREIDRVLAPGGAVVWVNSLGDRTPIHLSAEDVAEALPGAWTGRAAEAGWGSWCVLRRVPSGAEGGARKAIDFE